MFLFFTLLFISLSLLAHEFGHADASRRLGRPVVELGFGLPFGPSFKWKPKGKWAGTVFSIYPLCPFGAFIRNEMDVKETNYHDGAFVFGAGPLASFIAGWALQILAYGVGFADHTGITWQKVIANEGFYFPLAMIAVTFLCLKLARDSGFIKKLLFSYILPFVSIIATVWLVQLLLAGTLTSIIGITNRAGEVSELSGAMYFAGKVSVAIGLGALLPLYPMDGGQTFLSVIQNRVPKFVETFKRYGIMIFGLLVIFAVQHDIFPIIAKYL